MVKVRLAHDWDKLRTLLGDDFQLIESEGRLGDRDSTIAGCKEEASSVVTISLRQRDGSIAHRYERFTDVWVLRNQWAALPSN